MRATLLLAITPMLLAQAPDAPLSDQNCASQTVCLLGVESAVITGHCENAGVGKRLVIQAENTMPRYGLEQLSLRTQS